MPSELYVSREIKVFLSRKTAPSELFDYLSAGIDREAADLRRLKSPSGSNRTSPI
ncbi:hypothetical protein [Neisseria uirgultaei]|uniref:hypothetical protein n=1 Tax=Neisseria uirgultaei TaxID=2830646 RepID=UPI00265AD2DF|nr:hypothetical protein [Neisseria uirgultaei]